MKGGACNFPTNMNCKSYSLKIKWMYILFKQIYP